MLTEKKVCCICNSVFEGWGNNPEPFDGKACCDDCNDRFVTPTRMCLGRNCENKEVLLLIQTIAELGKCFKAVTAESFRQAKEGKSNGDPRKPF